MIYFILGISITINLIMILLAYIRYKNKVVLKEFDKVTSSLIDRKDFFGF